MSPASPQRDSALLKTRNTPTVARKELVPQALSMLLPMPRSSLPTQDLVPGPAGVLGTLPQLSEQCQLSALPQGRH